MTTTEIAGFVGAGLAGAAYVPQISHLIRAHCSAGISRLAFEAWLLASMLTTARAVAIHAGVFIALGGIQIVATALIMLCAARYKDTPCPSHVSRPARGRAAASGDGSDNERGSSLRAFSRRRGMGAWRRALRERRSSYLRPDTRIQATHLKGTI